MTPTNMFTNNFTRYSDAPVEVGMIRYVGSPVAGEDVAACVVTKILPSIRVWDPEYRRHLVSYPYKIRRATKAEEVAYLALPAHSAASAAYRAEG